MRFAFKTAPQHMTWSDMLALWKEGDDIELFESAWNFDHFYPIFGGRDPAEITLSSHMRLDPGLNYRKTAETAAALGEKGMDLAIVTLPQPYSPAVLTPLAEIG